LADPERRPIAVSSRATAAASPAGTREYRLAAGMRGRLMSDQLIIRAVVSVFDID
jgi:hypothetical protein